MLEELDAQFGIGELVEQDITEQKMKKYSRDDLTGLQVQHDMTRLVKLIWDSLEVKGAAIGFNECRNKFQH